MGQDTENIEAKLCAYVDGELDAVQREQIEQYLRGNPQHQQVIEELMGTREVLRQLPRVKAPGNIAEALQGQLERSALLGAEEGSGEGGMRLYSWRQFSGIAAILLLTAGLGAIIYFVLPAWQNPSVSVVDMKGIGAEETGGPVVDGYAEKMGVRGGDKVGEGGVGRGKSSLAGDGGGIDGKEMAGKAMAMPVAPSLPGNAEVGMRQAVVAEARNPAVQSIQDWISNIAPADPVAVELRKSGNNKLFLVVASRNPSEANDRVTAYFASNSIQWSPVREPMPQPLGVLQGQRAEGSRLNELKIQMRDAGAVGAWDQKEMAAQKPAAQNMAPGWNVDNTMRNYEQQMTVNQNRGVTTRGAEEQALAKQSQGPAGIEPGGKSKADVAGNVSPNNLYIGFNLKRRQAVELQESLARQPGYRGSVVYEQAESAVAGATTQPLAPVAAQSNVYGASVAAAQAEADPASARRRISIAKTEPIEESAHFDREMFPSKSAPAGAVATGWPGTQPSTTQAVPTTQAATQPGQLLEFRQPEATTLPSEQSVRLADGAGGAREEAVDVVIVVQQEDGQTATAPPPAPASFPATQQIP